MSQPLDSSEDAGDDPANASLEDRARGQRIAFCISAVGGVDAMSERSGIPGRTLERYATGAELKVSRLIAIARAAQMDVGWLATGSDRPTGITTRTSPEHRYLDVPLLDVRVSAGEGLLVDRERVVGTRAFSRDWLLGELRMDPDDLKLCVVHGDSMRPTLDDGDLVMVNVKETKVWRDDVYVLRDGDSLMVKRLQRLPVGGFKVLSDNPAYPAMTIMPTQAEERQMAIVGRVVWWAHTNAR